MGSILQPFRNAGLRWGLGKASNEAGTKQTEETCYGHGVVGIQVW